MNFIALKMLTGDRAKYLALIFAIAFSTFLLENQTSIFAGILRRTGSQIRDVTEAGIWVMDRNTEYFEQTKSLKDTDLNRVRGVDGVQWAVKLFKGSPVARTLEGKFAVTFCLGVDDATLTCRQTLQGQPGCPYARGKVRGDILSGGGRCDANRCSSQNGAWVMGTSARTGLGCHRQGRVPPALPG